VSRAAWAGVTLAVALAGPARAGETVAAFVAGDAVTLAGVDGRCGADCGKLAAEVLERKWAAVETLVDEALLAGAPVEPPPVEPAAVERFIAEHAEDFHGPPERDRAAVRFFLARERRRALEAARVAAAKAARPPVWHLPPGDPALAGADPARVVVEAGGRTIRDADVEARLALPLYRLRGLLARERRRVLDVLIEEALWAAEARAEGSGVEALRARVRAAAAPVTDADVARWVASAARARPDRVRPYLEFRAARGAEEAFLADARARHGVRVLLHPPHPPRLALGAGASGWQGPADATVRIVFLTGWRGTASRLMWPIVRALADAPDTALAVRPLLPQWDPEGTAAAVAVRCAGPRWRAVHDAVLAAPTLPAPAEVERLAAAAGVAVPAFRACIADPASAAGVAAESAEAERLGLDEPPAVLIDGRALGGVQSRGRLRAIVRRARRDAGG
jgi:2-hydroxychromene-2-carboxylate isomerase